ncbi:bifunctional [glutamate--ammonia ligase]-adenylyl-L-tyrosine phosphorylase/[glutamate--ammonia-ligase] adenylyltransferase [Mycetohabitans rhizoxinica]
MPLPSSPLASDAAPLLSAAYSRYAARQYAARPELAARVRELARVPLTRHWIEQRLAQLGAPQGEPVGDDVLKRALRLVRTELFCAVMERDLAGLADVPEVTGAMTDLAEVAIRRSLVTISAELHALYGMPLNAQRQPQTLGVIGMGKLGGRELNVSSDIDLIFVYEDDGETEGGSRAPISNQDFFTRVGRRLIGALAEHTADGYVFRVDMRLRPNGDSGPLVCSIGMLEEYFYVQGREWERYAWIKARLVSNVDSDAGARLAAQLEAQVRPFVYRRYLDFGVIAAIRALHVQIRQEAARRASSRRDKADDIKLGRGGIREIEFTAQVFQLIRGGQDAGFRIRPTLAVLDHAASHGLIARGAVQRLAQAYHMLRCIEHRLQYVNDAQTHAMPVDEGERAQLAASLGFADYPALLAVLECHREFVAQQFEQIFARKRGNAAAAGAGDPALGKVGGTAWGEAATWIWSSALADEAADDELRVRLASLGFNDPPAILLRLHAVWQSARYASLPERHRARFDTLVLRALEAAPTHCHERVDATLLRFLDLLEAVARRGSYLALLVEYPAALARVFAVLGESRWAAGYLIRHPQVLDELLDDEALASPFDWTEFKRMLLARLADADGAEHQMDLLRHAHQAEVFRILLLDLGGHLSVEHISDRLSELADAVLDVTLQTVWPQLARRHCDVPRFSIIAYGKLGGKELGYASDLDLIFLYDDPDERAAEIYALFARRLITWLTMSTGAGTLFDVDLRLRPNGEAGLLVTSLTAFRRYQLREGDAANTAWVWEHQALSRARFCAGDAAIGVQFEAIRAQVLAQPRDARTLATEIAAMRQKVAQGHPNPTALFDLKHDRGGMVDIEFIVQYWVLLYAGAHPTLRRNTGNIALLREAARIGLMSETQAEQVGGAYRAYRKLQHALRLDGMDKARVPPERVQAERDAVTRLWEQVFGA